MFRPGMKSGMNEVLGFEQLHDAEWNYGVIRGYWVCGGNNDVDTMAIQVRRTTWPLGMTHHEALGFWGIGVWGWL